MEYTAGMKPRDRQERRPKPSHVNTLMHYPLLCFNVPSVLGIHYRRAATGSRNAGRDAIVWPLLFLMCIGLAGCATPTVGAGATPGVYHDSRFGFDVTLPQGWRAGSWENTKPDVGECAHDVDVFPPGSKATAQRGIEGHEPELMAITVTINCPQFSPSADPALVRDPEALTVAGASAALYTHDSPQSLVRLAVVSLHGREYLFMLQAPLNKSGDVDLFMRMLQSVTFLGG